MARRKAARALGGMTTMEWVEAQRRDPVQGPLIELEIAAMNLEQDLLALREKRGVTQAELAAKLGVKQPVISRIERGQGQNLQLRTLVAIAAALGARVKITFEPRAEPAKRRKGRAA
ncbi:MAG: helix-turn-helix transcriptional regulator [Candidatus Rokubacteria bacterium]|nr:helix-turn-helix transcriptional regulator [Candidatus Rokubacteria bacterium]